MKIKTLWCLIKTTKQQFNWYSADWTLKKQNTIKVNKQTRVHQFLQTNLLHLSQQGDIITHVCVGACVCDGHSDSTWTYGCSIWCHPCISVINIMLMMKSRPPLRGSIWKLSVCNVVCVCVCVCGTSTAAHTHQQLLTLAIWNPPSLAFFLQATKLCRNKLWHTPSWLCDWETSFL